MRPPRHRRKPTPEPAAFASWLLIALFLFSSCARTESPSLKVDDLQPGTGAEAVSGKLVTVHYTGWLVNGTKFDSSVDRNQTLTFRLGAGRVIRGWDEGLVGMKVGGKRKLTIPPRLGYGAKGSGKSIPPNATLIFEIDLLNVREPQR
ncbi:MAG: FKBP-type peptidyl-prolyl cis-trans isomerase [Deltaproteobacteria bacterium]|nr:FKBP-type peptidyl-prolyl cis-trans isomerase [Deltaproteobacteria bacterium]